VGIALPARGRRIYLDAGLAVNVATEHVPDGTGRWRPSVILGAFALAYVLTAQAGLLLAIPPGNVTAVWPPSGLAVAVLWLGGVRLWPAVSVATIVVTLLTGAPLAAALGFAVGNTLEALLAVGALRWARFDATRMNLRDVGTLAFLAAGAATIVAGAIGAATLVLTSLVPPEHAAVSFVTWWVGDALGILLVTPCVLVWVAASPSERRFRIPELSAVLAIAVVLGAATFRYAPSDLYLTFPPLLWAAGRMGLRGAVSVTLLLWVVGAAYLGPESVLPGSLPLVSALGESQLYFGVLGVVGLLLGGAINERDRARQGLRSREEWFRTILDHVFDIVAVVEPDGSARWVSASLAHVLGFQPEDLVGKPMEAFVHPNDVERCATQLARIVARPNDTVRVQARVRHADGGWRTIESNVSNALDTPGVGGLVLSARDVTTSVDAARVLEQARVAALESARTRSEFLANVSHELRTPLNVVFGITDMLLDDALPTHQAEKVRSIRNNAASLLHLIDDILDLAKIDAGRLEIRRSPFELATVVEEAVAALRLRADAKGLVVEASVDDRLGPVIGDPGRVRQILLNYLGNAVKFTEHGSVTVRAQIVEEQASTFRVRIEVQDSGIGISEDRLHRLFQPFSQVDGSMSRRYPGTGLGLAISKQLTEMMGGQVGVSSLPGLGSIFWCELPMERVSDTGRDATGAVPVLPIGGTGTHAGR